ncbi:integrin alpha [Flindersiella endophytica]
MSLTQGRHAAVALAAGGLLLLTASLPAAAAAGEPLRSNVSAGHVRVRPGDFDGDRLGDLAVAATAATIDGQANAGAVGVVYGGRNGLDLARLQRLDRSAGWISGEPRSYEDFGQGLAAGDYNADGYVDMAICSSVSAGAQLTLAFGSPGGLRSSFSVATPDRNCFQLSSGDFDRDGATDLVVPSLDGDYVMYGRTHLSPSTVRYTALDTIDDEGNYVQAGPGASGDVNGDGYPDHAAWYEFFDGQESLDRLAVFFGGPRGLDTRAGQIVKGPNPFRSGGPVAIGDLTGDGYAEVVQGYFQDGPVPSGEVVVHFGSSRGLVGRLSLTQATAGVPGSPESGDFFGQALAIGDANGDGIGDLAIGSPGEDVGTVVDAGMVTVIPGKRGGLDPSKATAYTQNSPDVAGSAEASDWFGTALLFRDLTGDWRSDLVAGSPGENDLAGLVHVFEGSRGGVTADDSLVFGPRRFGIAPRPPEYAFFGIAFG